MKFNYNQFATSFKRMTPQDFIYPGMLLLFFIAVIIAFSFTVQFISGTISTAFYVETPQESLKLNVSAYKLTAQKLNFTIEGM